MCQARANFIIFLSPVSIWKLREGWDFSAFYSLLYFPVPRAVLGTQQALNKYLLKNWMKYLDSVVPFYPQVLHTETYNRLDSNWLQKSRSSMVSPLAHVNSTHTHFCRTKLYFCPNVRRATLDCLSPLPLKQGKWTHTCCSLLACCRVPRAFLWRPGLPGLGITSAMLLEWSLTWKGLEFSGRERKLLSFFSFSFTEI